MTAKEAVESKRQQLIRQLNDWDKILDFVEANAEKFDLIGVTPNIYTDTQIDLDNPTREQVLIAIKQFPGKWNKGKHADIMHYESIIDGIKIRLWATELPPSCKVETRTVVIPAQPERIEEVQEIVCNVA